MFKPFEQADSSSTRRFGGTGLGLDGLGLDIQMPVMDGYRATQHIQEIAPHLPVIGLMAHAMNEENNVA